MKLSACLIVKNEANNLELTLPVLSRYADEIVLVDTGSTDNTVDLARQYGARIFHFAWINDFAAARNYSLEQAIGDYILWVDADENLTEENLKTLKAVLDKADSAQYALTIYECDLGACEKKNGYERVKVFKNGLGYKFTRPINEQLVDANGKVVEGEAIPVDIYHWGRNLGAEKMDEKRARYVELYSKALESHQNDPHLHFLLANNLSELKRFAEALAQFDSAAQFGAGRDIGRQALEKKADLLLRTRQLPAAAQTAEELLRIDPDNIPARNVIASIFLVSGKIDQAIAVLADAVKIKVKGVENLLQTKAMPNFLLGKAYEIKGEKEKARECYERVRTVAPEMVKGK